MPARGGPVDATVWRATSAPERDVSIDATILFALVLPLVLIQLVLMVIALYDLTRPTRRVTGDNKVVWALVIIFVSTIGPILYFLAGRQES